MLTAVALGVWWVYPGKESPSGADATGAVAPVPLLTTDRPEAAAEAGPQQPGVPEKGANLTSPATTGQDASVPVRRAKALIAAGKQALDHQDPVAARAYFSEAMQVGADEPQLSVLRGELTRLGNETVFSPRVFESDPFVDRHIVQSGDTLGKIAKANKVSADLLAAINGIRDKNRIRAGQTLKVIKGPFHAQVDTGSFTMRVYLGTTFVKQFPVGVGADQSTPRGEWRVSTKLKNPTYYPPRGGMIVAADDPENPLGERWIGLEGISGEARGQLRYGIHGTNDPESVGRRVSLGCIRLHNEDVEALYTYLVEKHSTVVVR